MTAKSLGLVIATLAAAGCDPLRSEPGADFSVKVVSDTPVAAIGQIAALVRFAVTGCSTFQAAVEGGGVTHAVAAAKQADGSFTAAVPVEWLREEDRTCLDDASTPHASMARLLVTCADASRTAATELPISYGTATRAYPVDSGLAQASVQYLFQSADPFRPYALATSPLVAGTELDPLIQGIPLWIDGTAALADPLARPRLAVSPTAAFLSSGCGPPHTCPQIAVSPDTNVPGALLYGQGQSNGVVTNQLWPVWVAATVLDLAFLGDGTLVVLSEASDQGFPFAPAAAVLTRVVPASTGGVNGTADAAVIGYFPGELARTRFSRTAEGRLAFVTFAAPPGEGPLRSTLHFTDGQAVESLPGPTGDLDIGQVYIAGSSFSIGSAQLAPDASSMVVDGTLLGAPGGSFTQLPVDDPFYPGDGDSGGAVWAADAVVLWRGMSFMLRLPTTEDVGRVESFDLAPPHARRFRYDVHPLPGGRGVAQLLGATAVGDKLVLTTSTGVRVLGPDGAVVGGADPLPCGLSPTALATPTGPTTFAVAAGRFVYAFDLAAAAN